MCEDNQSTGIWSSVSSGFSSRKAFIGNSQASDNLTMQSLSDALHVNSIADIVAFTYFTSVGCASGLHCAPASSFTDLGQRCEVSALLLY